MRKTIYLLSLLAAGAVASAATLPDYPLVYSPEVGGPVLRTGNAAPAASAQSAQLQSKVATDAAPEGYTTPADAALMHRYTISLNGAYSFKATPNNKYACDMAGLEIEGAYYVVPHHAVTLSMGFAGGGATRNYWVHDHRHHVYEPYTDSFDRGNFTLMGGYRYSHAFGRYFVVQLGAKCGLDVQTLSVDNGYGWHGHADSYDSSRSHSAAGLGYAGYVNLGAFITPHTCVHVGYQFRGTTAAPSVPGAYPDMPRQSSSSMRWHEVRVGITCSF